MNRPTIKGNYTKEDLKKYALYRKDEEFKTIDKIKNDVEDSKEDNYNEHELYSEPSAITDYKLIKIELSTGGDADGFKLEYSHNGKYWELQSGLYYWADWGVYEEVPLSNEEAEEIAEFYAINIDE